MKTKKIILAAIVCLATAILIIAVFKKDEFPPAGCLMSGGVWKKLPDSCSGNCSFRKEPGCLTVVSFGCDCGDSRCWNGKKCEPGQ